jgi:hypothetical protein
MISSKYIYNLLSRRNNDPDTWAKKSMSLQIIILIQDDFCLIQDYLLKLVFQISFFIKLFLWTVIIAS